MNMRKIILDMSKKGILTMLLLLVGVIGAFAQSGVKGTVVDEDGEPLIGVTVRAKSGNGGAITDIDGKFVIPKVKSKVFVFSYIGYKNVEMRLTADKEHRIVMQGNNATLNEVVVVGYGNMKRSDITGSITSVNEQKIQNFKTGSVVEALGGQMAGVQVTASDGTPGSGFDIRIRGVGTVNGDSSPLFIVDGFEVSNIDYLANSDIESIDVLKDASASAIYGARAANGVVLVKTKSGRQGRPVIAYNGSFSLRSISKHLDLLDPYEFAKLQMEINPTKYAGTYYKEGNDADGAPYRYQSLDDYMNVAGIDWQGEAFKSTWSQNHDFSISGGSKESQYAVSFSHFDEDGIFTNSSFQKNTGKLRLKQNINKSINMDATINYSNSVKKGIGTAGTGGSLNVLSNLLRARPTGGLQVSDEELLTSVFDPLLLLENDSYSQINPIRQAEAVNNRVQAELWGANLAFNVRLMKGLTLRSAATYNVTNTRSDLFYGENSSQAYRGGGTYGSTQMQKDLRWSANNTLTYKTVLEKKHHLEAMLGHEFSFRSNEYLIGQAKDFPFENLGNDNLGLGATPSQVGTNRYEKKLLSFFARANYNFDNRYLLTATLRADGSTVFAQNHKWGYFPSFSAAWRVSEESFMKNVKPISNLKLRLGWGTVGNDRISNYLSMDLYTESKYGVGNKVVTVLTPKQLANMNLKWEGQSTLNAGIDLGLFDSRVNLSADFYIKNTKDLLLAQNLAYITGFESQWQNIGKVQNKGLELNLNTINVRSKKLMWQTDINVSFVKNTLKSLQDGAQSMYSATRFNSNFSSYDYVAMVGESLGKIYGYQFDGVYQMSDFNLTPSGTMTLKPGVADISKHAGRPVVPGMVKYKDVDGNGMIDTADRTVIGNGYPTWYGGITNTLHYAGVDLSILFQFSCGNDIYNATRMFNTQTQDERSNQLAETADRWTPTHASNMVPSAKGYVKNELYSRFVEDGSYLRLKNVTLGYTVPAKLVRKWHLSKLRVYGTAQNLFCLTKYSGYDPEVNMRNSPLMPGFDWGAYPKSRVFTFGLEVQF
uniref:TonB-dependent receptor n=1 Tax=Prevotella sp. GTC17259 TaxID=3236795 RepID=A0AB33JGH2_9BACT